MIHLSLEQRHLALTVEQYEACCRTLEIRLATGTGELADRVLAQLLMLHEGEDTGARADGAAPGLPERPLDFGAAFERFYERCSREAFDEARAILAGLEEAFGRGDGDIVMACWSLDAEDV